MRILLIIPLLAFYISIYSLLKVSKRSDEMAEKIFRNKLD